STFIDSNKTAPSRVTKFDRSQNLVQHRYHLPPCHHGKPNEQKESVTMRSCWTTWKRLTISSCSSTMTWQQRWRQTQALCLGSWGAWWQ
ncbi:hypothetical protein AALO_G00185870, partial [Alosa alosa]